MLLKCHSLHKLAMGDFFMKQDLTVSGVYIAAIIGAGFASGSEIVHYFAVYGKIGIIGILISSTLFGLVAAAILKFSAERDCNSFGVFMEKIFPKPAAKLMNIIIILFMMCVFTAMVAGSGETVSELIAGKRMAGVIIILLITAVVLLFDIRGLMAANGVMAIFIVAGVLGVCFYLFNFREISAFSYSGEWLVSGTVYTGYNILTAAAVLPSMSRFTNNYKRVGIISAICIFVLLSALWGIISIYHGKIPLGAIPMLTICKRHGMLLSIIYSIVLFMAMLTTALANGFALADVIKGNKLIKIGIIISAGFLLSGFSFDFFVGIVYRCAGYAGIFFMFFILIKNYKKNKIVRKTKKNKVN